MAYEELCEAFSRPAAAAMATTRVGVVINSSNQLAVATSGYCDGVLAYAVDATGDSATYYPFCDCPAPLVRAGGTCTAGSDAMLTTGGKFIDCTPGNIAVGRFLTGQTTDGALVSLKPYSRPQQVAKSAISAVTADGAITIPSVPTNFMITKAGVAAMTLADPAATDNGLILRFVATTANAHTLSNAAGSGFNAGGAAKDIGTFGGAIGDNIAVIAYGGKWIVLSSVNVTLA